LCCLCIENTQDYIDNCTFDTIAAAGQALALPPLVSIASKYIDIPQSLKDAAKPPTGASLMKIKGIMPQVNNAIHLLSSSDNLLSIEFSLVYL
jgi:hypothetical protein